MSNVDFPPSFCPLQYVPVPEVPGGVGVGAARRLCIGVQVRVPVAFLAFHPKCLRLFQIPGAGERCAFQLFLLLLLWKIVYYLFSFF